MDYYILIKYFDGTASDEEKKQIFDWIQKDLKNKNEFSSLKKTWALMAKSNLDQNAAWDNFSSTVDKNRNRRKLYQLFYRAAIFIAILGLGALLHYFIYLPNSNKEIYQESFRVTAPLGQMTNLKLPDGTEVLLNSGSAITYNTGFTRGSREVELEGEAFFDVQKDVEHPFIVKTSLIDVKVYGTSFNIEAYYGETKFVATLVEGSIGVLNKTGVEIAKLEPGEKASYTVNQKRLIVNNVNTEIYTSWKDGLITFRNEKLEDIAKRIERWYNVEIIIRNEQVANQLYFGTILKNKPIDQILEVLKLTTSLKYEIHPRSDKPTLIYWD